MSLPLERLSLWLTLDAVTGIGPVTAARLLAHVGGDITTLFDSDDGALRALGLQSAQIQQMRWPLPVVEQGLSWAAEPGNHLLCPDDPAYPALLKEIPGAPLLLYCRGNVSSLSLPQLAMVGTRHPTYAGKDNATRLCAELVGCGLAITSGLALGIDGVCHQQALASGGITLAVLGSGLDCLYPKRHQGLAMQILEQEGLLVSELAPQQGPWLNTSLAATVSSVACRWGHWWWKRQNRVVRSSRPVMRWSRAARSLPFPALRKMHRQQGATVCFNRVPSWS